MSNWRFRRRIRIMPGVYINVSKSGISSSVGVRGANLTLGSKGTYLNTGIPGTGIYKRQRIGNSTSSNQSDRSENIFNDPANDDSFKNSLSEHFDDLGYDYSALGSKNTIDIEHAINLMVSERKDIQKELINTDKEIKKTKSRILISKVLIVGFFLKGLSKKVKELEEYKLELFGQKDLCFVKIDNLLSEDSIDNYEMCLEKVSFLNRMDCIWDITSEEQINNFKEKTSASRGITRQLTLIELAHVPEVKCDYAAIHFRNAKGFDLYFYPTMLIISHSIDRYIVVDYSDVKLSYQQIDFLETESISSDAIFLRYTWYKVNKDGSPDRRFKNNYKIPIYQYGTLKISTHTGLIEEYMFSNYNMMVEFTEVINSYIIGIQLVD